jgi:hypothetical protein
LEGIVGGIPLSQEEKVNVLVKISARLGLTVDEVLALYLVVGDGLFFILDLLQGKTVSFPSLRALRSSISKASEYQIKRLSKLHYLINGVEDFPSTIKRGDDFVVSGVTFSALGSPQSILGEMYVLCKCKE